MKNYLFFTMLFLISLFFTFPIPADNEVIGVISQVEGELIHNFANKEENLKRTDKIYSDSIIKLGPDSISGWVEILTANGPVRFSRFPVSGFGQFNALPNEIQASFIIALGGSVIMERGELPDMDQLFLEEELFGYTIEAEDIFEWYLPELGCLTEKEIEDGFHIVISRDKNSKETQEPLPLYFQIKEDIYINDVSFALVNEATGQVEYSGKYKHEQNDWSFYLSLYDLKQNIPYALENVITLTDGREIYFMTSFTLKSEEEINNIQSIYQSRLNGYETEFQKKMLLASIYQSYNMKIPAIRILKSIEVDIQSLF